MHNSSDSVGVSGGLFGREIGVGAVGLAADSAAPLTLLGGASAGACDGESCIF